MVMQEHYQVTLDAFHGPLDLLLYLIRRAEVDIHDIPIGKITDQYLEFLGRQRSVDIDAAGEFLVLAATLIEIKSRLLMPPGEASNGDDDGERRTDGGEVDPRYELVQQLLAYQRFRNASERLDERRVEFERMFALRPGRIKAMQPADEEPDLELEDVHVMDLAEAYERIAAAIDFSRLGEHNVEIDDTPLELYEEDLVDRLKRRTDHTLTLQEAFEGQTPLQRVGMFLATLELTRTRRVEVTQDQIDDPIQLALRDDADGSPNDADDMPTASTTDS